MALVFPKSFLALLFCVCPSVVALGCSKSDEHAPTPLKDPPAAPAPSPAPPAPAETAAPAAPASAEAPGAGDVGAAAAAAGISGALTVDPNPVVVCEKTGLGAATISWTVTGTDAVEVRVGAPDGSLFASAGKSGKSKTGNWIKKGGVFYLQDGRKDVPRTAEHTIAKLEIENTVPGPCK